MRGMHQQTFANGIRRNETALVRFMLHGKFFICKKEKNYIIVLEFLVLLTPGYTCSKSEVNNDRTTSSTLLHKLYC